MQISYNDIQVGDAVTIRVKCGMRVIHVTGVAQWKAVSAPTWWKLKLTNGAFVPCDDENFVSVCRIPEAKTLLDSPLWVQNQPKAERPKWLQERDKKLGVSPTPEKVDKQPGPIDSNWIIW